MTEDEKPEPTPYYCKYCQTNIEVIKPIEFATHVRKCKKALNKKQVQEYRAKIKIQIKKASERNEERKQKISRTLRKHHQKITAPTPEDMEPVVPLPVGSAMSLLDSALDDLEEKPTAKKNEDGRKKRRVVSSLKTVGKTTLRTVAKIAFRDDPPPVDYNVPLTPAPAFPTADLEIFDIVGDADESDGEDLFDEHEDGSGDMVMVSKSQLNRLVEEKIAKNEANAPATLDDRVAPRSLEGYQRENQQRNQFLRELNDWVERGGPVPENLELPEGMEGRELSMAKKISKKGFTFGLRPASVFQEVKDFRRASLIFINQDKFEAFYYLADDFIHAFWQWCGGYGLDDHKKYIAQQVLSKLNRLFKHLRGELRRQKEYKNLRNFVENHVFRKLMEVVHAVMTDTLQKRETDTHEINIERAKAYIHGAEDEGQAYRDLGWGAEDRYGEDEDVDVDEENIET